MSTKTPVAELEATNEELTEFIAAPEVSEAPAAPKKKKNIFYRLLALLLAIAPIAVFYFLEMKTLAYKEGAFIVENNKLLDMFIKMFTEDGLPTNFMQKCNFIEVDWLFCLTRAGRQTPHRYEERMALIEEFAVKFCDYMMSIDYERDESFNDLHMLFGACCALAELQSALPGKIITEKPLRLVLDRRPFI